MARVRYDFEVQVLAKDHWVIESRGEDEAAAIQRANKVLNMGSTEGVRVMRLWTRADGAVVEKEIMTAFRPKATTVQLQKVEEAPLCQTLRDVLQLSARSTLGRVLRRYLDQVGLTQTELIHNHGELKRLRDKDNLLLQAIGHLAAVQVGAADARVRRDQLFQLLDQVGAKAKAAQVVPLPAIKSVGLTGVWKEVEGKGEEAEYLAMTAMTRELSGYRNWPQKLAALADILRREIELPEAPVRLVDGLIADVLQSAEAVQDILGPRPNLAMALEALLDLAEGRLEHASTQSDDPVPVLNENLARIRLPQTRQVLLDCVARQLKHNTPLSRNAPAKEAEAFARIVRRIVSGLPLTGGPDVTAALVLRGMLFHPEGGLAGRRKGMGEVLSAVKDPFDRLRFLCTFVLDAEGRKLETDIQAEAARIFTDPVRMLMPDIQPTEIMERMTRNWQALCAIEGDLARDSARRIDEVLADYIEKNRVVARLDDRGSSLRERSTRLIAFCMSGTVVSPKALDTARCRIIGHLRQPDFERLFVSDIPDLAGKARALKDFHLLLRQAGFVG